MFNKYRVGQIKKSIRENLAFKVSHPSKLKLKDKNVPGSDRYDVRGVPDSLGFRFDAQVLT